MKKEYLPFYDSLNQKEKDFWLNCSKETLIDHFISNVRNGEVLLNRIEKAFDFLENENIIVKLQEFENKYTVNFYDKKEELKNILLGSEK